ncbi:MAG: excisionase [Firmicutes bacterium]|nr:excisionase [Bacillota bacterium]
MKKFTLMNKNKKVFDFVYDEEEHFIVNFERNYPENEDYAPFGLIKMNEIDKVEFNKWWKNRQIPASRKGLKEVLHNSNVYDKDNFDLLDAKAYCLSLSDQYWVKGVDEEISWESINFFDNEFSEDIGKILFNGGKTALNLNLNTPDMTSNGNYEKRWKIIDGKRYLLKAGSKIYNQEPFNELIATKLYERLLNKEEYVEYSVIFDDDKAISKCKNFITKDTELVPAWKINEYYEFLDDEDKYTHYIRCLNNLGIKDAETLTDKMIVCDYIIANKDRHFNNFGVIRDVNTLKFIGVAPIFDNGCSLWYDENDMYVGEFFLTKPFEEYEKTQLSLVKKLEWLDISKLEDFPNEVKTILSMDKLLSKERINKIVDQIKLRIEFVKELKKSREVDADNGCEI